MAAKKKSTRAKPRRKYVRRAKIAELSGSTNNNGVKIETEQPQTLTQKLHATEQERDALRSELNSVTEFYQRERDTIDKASRKEINGLQNEIGTLRSMLARMTYGGVHVRDVERIGPGAK